MRPQRETVGNRAMLRWPSPLMGEAQRWRQSGALGEAFRDVLRPKMLVCSARVWENFCASLLRAGVS